MKLQTSIRPRADGTVTVEGSKGKRFKFEEDANGDLVCEVDDLALVGRLLKGGNFFPVDERDFNDAARLTGASSVIGGEAPAEDDDGDDDGDDPVDLNALPVEGVAAGEEVPAESTQPGDAEEDAEQAQAAAPAAPLSRRRAR